MRTRKIVSNKKIYIPYAPSPIQSEIHHSTHRFKVLDNGRRWGKTWCLVAECNQIGADVCRAEKRLARGWIVAPTYPLVKETWRVANELLANAIIDKRETDLWMLLPWTEIEFKSAERSDEGLRGAGLDFVGVDEAARVDRASWEYGLRPALSDRQGKAIFISTPKGQNWFYEMWLKGQEEHDDIKSWKWSTIDGWRSLYGDNPEKMKNLEKEWLEIEASTPEMIFKQEYLAEFLEDESTVFRGLSKIIHGHFEDAKPGETYCIGADFARTHDFNVFTVLKKYDNQVVKIVRFKERSWEFAMKELFKLQDSYNKAMVVVDSTGVGDPIYERLQYEGMFPKGYKFNSRTKEELIEQLMLVIEHDEIGIPEAAEEMLQELRQFEYEVMPTTRRIRYNAPEGRFDDCVISLGLAVMGMRYDLHLKRPEVKPIKTELTWGEYHEILGVKPVGKGPVIHYPSYTDYGQKGRKIYV